MTIRSMKWAAGVSLIAAVLAVGTTLPERQASAQVQAVPRAGIAFNDTVTQIVTILNLRQKGPGSKEERRESMNKPSANDIDSGRFTVTVVGVDLANNTVSVIEGSAGVVHTYRANTPAKQEMLKKTKVGDVVIGLRTPLTVTAISPAN